MLIGYTTVDYEALKKFVNNPDDIVTYVISQIPIWARHIDGICDNQRYYIALHLRKVLTIPYKQRTELVDALTRGIYLRGVCTNFVSITDIVNACDKESLIAMLKAEVLNV